MLSSGTTYVRILVARESNRPVPNRTGTFSCIRLSRHRIYFPQCFKPEQGRTTQPSNPFLVEALCPAPLRLAPTTGTLSPWALLPVGDPVVVCQVRSTFRASVRPLPRLIVGCALPEDHEVQSTHPVRQESGYQRLSRRWRNAPTGTGVQAIQPCPCVA